MEQSALFSITYGVYILGVEYEGKKNACVINTLSQLTQEPIKVSITVLKKNLTHDMILNSKKFSVSILSKYAPLDTIARFGFKSGKETDKLEGFNYKTDLLKNPIIEDGAVANISCKVVNSIDLGSHTLFIADVVDGYKLKDEESMTYAYYRDLKMGKVSNEKLPEKQKDKDIVETDKGKPMYQCSVCHYVYDGDIPFEELDEDYLCPLCNQPKSAFIKK